MRGRKAKLDTPQEWKLRLPTTIVIAVNDKLSKTDPDLLDPTKPRLGARSELVTKLLKAWITGEVKV